MALVVALHFARSGVLYAPPSVQFARGDGAAEASGGGGADTQDLPSTLLRGAAAAPPVTIPRLELGAEEAVGPAWPSHPPPQFEFEATQSEPGVIGLPWAEAPSPHYFGQGPAAAGGGQMSSAGTDAKRVPGDASGGAGDGKDAEGRGGTPGTPGGVADARLPTPVYPRESRLRGEQGTVVIEVDIHVDGTVVAVRIRDDAGYPRLAAAAVDAIKSAKFRPAIRDGRPLACTVSIPFRFRLRTRQGE